MKGKILVIEDEPAINDLLCLNLEAAGYELRAFFHGEEAALFLEEGEAGKFDLALLDIMLPGMDGFALLPLLRERGIPVIFLTAKGDVSSKVKGLKEGAEDYLVKPFEMLELFARMEKVLGRSREDCLEIGDVRIFPKRRRVEKEGKEVNLTPMEFDCLMLLIRHKNTVMTREELLAALWGVDFAGETRTIDVHIGRIRKKLGFGDRIRTIPRVGYYLEG